MDGLKAERDGAIVALGALVQMPAQRCCAAAGNGTEHRGRSRREDSPRDHRGGANPALILNASALRAAAIFPETQIQEIF